MALLDIERRIEKAALELLAAWTDLTTLVPAENHGRRRDTSTSNACPAVWVQAISFTEISRHVGWYLGALQLASVTYRADDKDQELAHKILGALRGWAQQTDLIEQLNATAVATAAATKLTVDHLACDGTPMDWSENRLHELILPLKLHAKPS